MENMRNSLEKEPAKSKVLKERYSNSSNRRKNSQRDYTSLREAYLFKVWFSSVRLLELIMIDSLELLTKSLFSTFPGLIFPT